MTNVPFSDIDDFRDIESLNYFKEATQRVGVDKHEVLQSLRRASRDNARTPMQWSSNKYAGFTTGNPWIGVNPNFSTINADSQVGNPNSIFEFYRSLISLRKREPILINGDFRLLEPEHQSLFSYVRAWRNESLLVMANFSSEPLRTLETESHTFAAQMEPILSNYEHSDRTDANELLPWEVRVFKG